MREPIRPARLRWKPPAGWRRWPTARSPPCRSPAPRKACRRWPSRTASGAAKSLADWRGRTVLLNLWATWCVPCRKEMPALDALQAKLGGADFEVVSVNIDTRDTDKPKDWLKRRRRQHARLLRRQQRQGVPGPQGDRQGVRHADHADRRSATAASLRPWRARRNGRAATRSSSSPPRSRNKFIPHHAVMSRLPPTPLATLARRLKFWLRGVEQLGDVGRGIGIHPQHLGGNRGLQLAGLRGDEGCGDRSDIHARTRYA